MKHILVIDDDQATAKVVADTLNFTDEYHVTVTYRGEEGVCIAQRQLPDLVICDIMMPVMDGYAVLDALKARPETSLIPVIFLTAKNTREDLRRSMEHGATDFIPKPFTPHEVLSAVKTRLEIQAAATWQFESSLRRLRRNINHALPHELRTPLTLVLGYSELLVEDLGALPVEEARSMAATIHKAGQRLQRLFENYLIYAHLEVLAADPVQMEAVRSLSTPNAAAIIRACAQQKAAASKRPDDLTIGDLTPATAPLSDDNLIKIMEEVLDNAFKFSPVGTAVIVSTRIEQGSYVLCVQDHGPGMSAENILHIGAYMQFQRLLKEQQGVGLGLIIVKRLAELYGGALRIESTPVGGTTVCVYLPIR